MLAKVGRFNVLAAIENVPLSIHASENILTDDSDLSNVFSVPKGYEVRERKLLRNQFNAVIKSCKHMQERNLGSFLPPFSWDLASLLLIAPKSNAIV